MEGFDCCLGVEFCGGDMAVGGAACCFSTLLVHNFFAFETTKKHMQLQNAKNRTI